MLTEEEPEAANGPDTIPPQAFLEPVKFAHSRVCTEGFGI